MLLRDDHQVAIRVRVAIEDRENPSPLDEKRLSAAARLREGLAEDAGSSSPPSDKTAARARRGSPSRPADYRVTD